MSKSNLKNLPLKIRRTSYPHTYVKISMALLHNNGVQPGSIRKPFTPRPVKLFNIKGQLTSKHTRAATLAKYLSDKLWKAPEGLSEISVEPPVPTDCGSFFCMGELNIVLRSLRTGRCPDPDGITAGLLKGRHTSLSCFSWIISTTAFQPQIIPTFGLYRKL